MEQNERPGSYEVHLDVFEGPFDLLLRLIARRKVDVTDVDLAEITADFLAHLDDLESLDLDTASRFLVVAATLIELKAARLLPAEEREELEDLLGEARDLLYARLLEYRAFRDVAELLRERHRTNSWYVGREVPLEPALRRLAPPTDLGIGAEELAFIAARALTPGDPPRIDLAHIRRTYLSLREAADLLLARLRAAGDATTFGSIADGRDRGERVVLFLALLELYKLGHLGIEQAGPDAPIEVERREADTDLDAILDEPEVAPEGSDGTDAGTDTPDVAAAGAVADAGA